MHPSDEREGEDVFDAIDRLEEKLDHLHDDLVALREWCRIPRPACYGDAPQEEPQRELGQGDRDA